MIFINKKKPLKKYRLKAEFRQNIKYYNFLFGNREVIMKSIAKYTLLRKSLNKNLKSRYILSHNFRFIWDNQRFKGILKIPGWKKKTREFNFFLDKNNIDNKLNKRDDILYEFWNMKPSYLKYIYSKINRMHPYIQIYNLGYRTFLDYPYSIIIKPYTIILKNFNFSKFFLVFEWSSKLTQLNIIMKVVHKKLKKKYLDEYFIINDFNNKIDLNYSKNFIYKILYKSYFDSKVYVLENIFQFNRNYNNKMDVILSKKKVRYLLWHRENWLWRLRANWKFLNLHQYIYTDRFKIVLLKRFKMKFTNIDDFDKKPTELFTNKFLKKFIEELFDLKFFNLSNKLRGNRIKLVNSYYDKNMFFKLKEKFINNFSLSLTSLYSRLYYIYFFWVIYFLKNIYKYINKIIFNLWVRFFCLTFNFYNTHNLKGFFSLDIDSVIYDRIIINYEYLFIKNIRKIINYHYLFKNHFIFSYSNKLYKSSYLIYKKSRLINLNIDNNYSLYFFNFYKIDFGNIYCYYFKCWRNQKNYSFYNIVDYFEQNNYVFLNSFKEYYLQTFRFITETPRGVLKNIKKNDNRVNFDKIYLSLNTIKRDELNYSNYELGLPEDKRMYFI